MNGADQIARWRDAIPEELWPLPVWLLWVRKPKPGKLGKFDKIPFYASGHQRHGTNGSAEDRAQLAEFGDALVAYQRGRYAGIGVALLPDAPFWALDLDDCIAPDGALSPPAQRVVASGSYAERSPSGHGVRALYAGKAGVDAKNHAAGVEVFDSRGFVTVTGDRLGGEALLPCPPQLLAEILSTVRADRRTHGVGISADSPPENPALVRDVRLPLALWRRLANPYPPGTDRSAAAFSIALQLSRAGLTREQTFAVMARTDCDVLAPALERRGGDIDSARAWLWRYCVLPAFQGDSHGR
jgi:GNAT superfamily N-acetyltransferase